MNPIGDALNSEEKNEEKGTYLGVPVPLLDDGAVDEVEFRLAVNGCAVIGRLIGYDDIVHLHNGLIL
jgi:hypothetical protein